MLSVKLPLKNKLNWKFIDKTDPSRNLIVKTLQAATLMKSLMPAVSGRMERVLER